jgi:hypothetical protein
LEQWPVFWVEEFPDIEAVQQYSEVMNELNMSRYLVIMSVLGTEMT